MGPRPSADRGREIGYSEFAPRAAGAASFRAAVAAYARGDAARTVHAASAPKALAHAARPARRRPRRPRARRRAGSGPAGGARDGRARRRAASPGRLRGEHRAMAGPPRGPGDPRLRRRARRAGTGAHRRPPRRRGGCPGDTASRRPDGSDRDGRRCRRRAELRRGPRRGRPPGAGRPAPIVVRRRRRPPPACLLAPGRAARRRGATGGRRLHARRRRHGHRRPCIGGAAAGRWPAGGSPAVEAVAPDLLFTTAAEAAAFLGVRDPAGLLRFAPGRRREARPRRSDAPRAHGRWAGRAPGSRHAPALGRRHDRRRRRLRRRLPRGLAGARSLDCAGRPSPRGHGRPPDRGPPAGGAASRARLG